MRLAGLVEVDRYQIARGVCSKSCRCGASATNLSIGVQQILQHFAGLLLPLRTHQRGCATGGLHIRSGGRIGSVWRRLLLVLHKRQRLRLLLAGGGGERSTGHGCAGHRSWSTVEQV